MARVAQTLARKAFIDEVVAAPPLLRGTYDLIADTNENGIFDIGIDIIDGMGSIGALIVRGGSLPEPTTLFLFGTGIVALVGCTQRKKPD